MLYFELFFIESDITFCDSLIANMSVYFYLNKEKLNGTVLYDKN